MIIPFTAVVEVGQAHDKIYAELISCEEHLPRRLINEATPEMLEFMNIDALEHVGEQITIKGEYDTNGTHYRLTDGRNAHSDLALKGEVVNVEPLKED